MKGVILGICPDARIVDISHAVPAHSIAEGAFLLGEVSLWYPKETIHVVVVDPGVGSARRPILLESQGQFFIGPDNGVFSMVRARDPENQVWEITNRKWMQTHVSRTFHGRDIFAPAAAHLAAENSPEQAGPRIHDALQLEIVQPRKVEHHIWNGAIIKVDHFGNLITNFHLPEFEKIRTSAFEVRIGSEVIHRLALHYAECPPGQPFVIEGSSGYLEVCVNQGSAAQQLGIQVGAEVKLRLD